MHPQDVKKILSSLKNVLKMITEKNPLNTYIPAYKRVIEALENRSSALGSVREGSQPVKPPKIPEKVNPEQACYACGKSRHTIIPVCFDHLSDHVASLPSSDLESFSSKLITISGDVRGYNFMRVMMSIQLCSDLESKNNKQARNVSDEKTSFAEVTEMFSDVREQVLVRCNEELNNLTNELATVKDHEEELRILASIGKCKHILANH
jgi:hypothetical protein